MGHHCLCCQRRSCRRSFIGRRQIHLSGKVLSRWNQVVEEEINHALSDEAQQLIRDNLSNWQGGQAPLSRKWVDDEVKDIHGVERDKARLVLLVAKASYQVDDGNHRANCTQWGE